MKLRTPRLLQNSIIYTFFNVIQKAIAFFLLPLYTAYLTPEDYGITNVLTTVTALLSYFYTFSIQSASCRFHFSYSKNQLLVKKIWGANFIFTVINSLFWFIISIILYKYSIIYLVGEEIPFYPYVIICLLNCAISPIFFYYQSYLQTTQQAKHFAINNLLYFTFTLLLTISFVVYLKMQALGVILSACIVTIIFSIYACYILRKKIVFNLSSKIISRSLKYSVPLIPHLLSGWLNGMLDRIFINRLINLSSVGLYSIGYQFGLIINMLAFGVNQAYSPWFFNIYNKKEEKYKITIVSDLTIAAISAIGFIIAIFSKEIVTLMTTEKYHDVWPSIIILVYANLINCLYYFYVAILFLQSTKRLSTITISCALINCITNYFLIKFWGYIGAAYSYFFVQFIKTIIIAFQSKKIQPDIIFNYKKHFCEAIIPLIFILVYLSYPLSTSLKTFFLKIIIILFFMSIFYILNSKSIKQIMYEIKN